MSWFLNRVQLFWDHPGRTTLSILPSEKGQRPPELALAVSCPANPFIVDSALLPVPPPSSALTVTTEGADQTPM